MNHCVLPRSGNTMAILIYTGNSLVMSVLPTLTHNLEFLSLLIKHGNCKVV